MSQRQNYTTKRLLLRSLKPSAVSLFFCLLIAFLMVGVNALLKSVDIGVALPGVFDGEWAVAYSENIVQPLSELFSNNTLNKVLIAGMWGLAGFLVYVGFEYGVHWTQTYKETRDNIRMARGGRVVQSPGVSDFWRAVIWRLLVLVGFVVIFASIMVPMLGQALGIAQSADLSENLARDGLRLVLAVFEWAFFFHFIVVSLRLYTMRTRLFGDDELY